MPCGPINDLAEVFADPQVQARGMTVEMPHPLAGTVAPGRQPDEAVGDAGALPPGAAAARRATPTPCWREFGLDAEAIAGAARARRDLKP